MLWLWIAGADEAHRTEIRLENVHIAGIKPEQVHLRLAKIAVAGTDIPLEGAAKGKAVKVLTSASAAERYGCEGKFVPMR
ncbi:MAG: hypothetical protein JO269_01795 [Burkholderiaceae bacterium]|nr:hypothetical protein [Burkholderiaceae bacterium]